MGVYEQILLNVEKPSRYVGGEYNLPKFKENAEVSFCIAFPDIYEVAMSNLGIQILYNILNELDFVNCERCFTPWKDMSTLLQKEGIPLLSIENKKPLSSFDIVGFSIQYEMSYTNIIHMLDLAKIPYFAKDRGEDFPIILGGGPCSANPEPYKDFFDIICIGDGEDFVKELATLYKNHKGTKKEFLISAKNIMGAYVPMYTYGEKVKKAVVKDLNLSSYPTKPLVSNMEIVHDRPVIELFRGCFAGCRFCQACFFYRPIRFRSEETVVKTACTLIESTGADELGLSSLSSGDYPHIKEVVKRVGELTKSKNVRLQLPSLRLDSFQKEITEYARKSSLTFAPEAGTQRLRDVINKNITNEDIENTARIAFSSGYRSLKLYFMVGLPTETYEDLDGIIELVKRFKSIYYEINRNNSLNITVSTSVFVPKPVTPFQWAKQIPMDEMIERQKYIRDQLKKVRGTSYSWHEESTSYLEGIFARGDSKLSKLIVLAYEMGAKFDGWSSEFNFDVWQQAIANCKVDVSEYLNEHKTDDILPWDFIDFGVKRDYLLKEYNLALNGEITLDCKNDCRNCGGNAYAKCKV